MYDNKITLIGRLVRDPFLKQVKEHTMLFLTIARKSTSSSDVPYEDIVVFGQYAVTLNKILAKGDLAVIHGKITKRKIDVEEIPYGIYATSIVAEELHVLESKQIRDNRRSKGSRGVAAQDEGSTEDSFEDYLKSSERTHQYVN
ncbi:MULTISPECIES: single-stranded DNA-binding protein [Latilactobacillus]|uniref:Single-stranded DNA-binding protein n=1 Tax=Latilactobacillus curvatus TaxID=28038 RepID=A0ABN6GM58_LATCU|nr:MULTISPECIES: single-stranded DNA-binding protein [Latilactobacillus]ASN13587.1 hypothetical protein B4V05_10165 [Latilactobacillus sakei]KGB13814.1 hypothetical protein KY41_11180 [Latilactobacillus sakei]MCW8780343.1 single-stranded DNA-binding protein [Latilactobacillus curvatus]UTB73291.1 hypothetical protein A4W72_11070 [Latilactobacillus curvatus]BCX31533.1 hypothetical protein LTWDN19_21000 [Latilactobacillus curvatus]